MQWVERTGSVIGVEVMGATSHLESTEASSPVQDEVGVIEESTSSDSESVAAPTEKLTFGDHSAAAIDSEGITDRTTPEPQEPLAPADTRTHHIERLEMGDGFIFVQGWLRGPAELLALEDLDFVLRGNGSELVTGQLGKLFSRPDLDLFEGSMPAAAFATVIYGPQAAAAATSYAILCRAAELASGVVASPIPTFKPLGHIDTLDANRIHGWVFDPGARMKHRRPLLIIDDEHTIPLNLGERRADLNFNDGTGNQCFAFSLTVSELGAALRAADPSFALCDGQKHSIALVSSDHEIDHRVFQFNRKINGRVERIHEHGLYGWAVDPTAPDIPITLDLFIDDVRYATTRAVMNREDLKAIGITSHGGGFMFELPPGAPGESGPPRLSVRRAFGKEELPGEPIEFVEVAPRARYHGHILDILPEPESSRVTIVVPIFNAASDLALCIKSIIQHTTGSTRLLLIDDASPDPGVAEVLGGWQDWPGVEILRNPKNLGYTATVNRGITLSAGDDVVLLNSDTIVGPGWLDGLRTAAYSSRSVGTVTAVSNNAGAFSIPEIGMENVFPTWFEVEDSARLVRQASPALMPALPTGSGFCMYMRRACIDAVGIFDEEAFPRGYGEENDFCMRAGRMGFLNLIDDRTFVYHKRSASFGETRQGLYQDGRRVVGERYPEYQVLTSQFNEDHDLLTGRWRLRRALDQVRVLGSTPRPRVLYVLSTRTGGTPQTNDDLMEALADRYEPWVLRCDSQTLELSCRDPGSERLVETHRLGRTIVMSSHASAEYDEYVADVLIRYAFELVHIRHMAWHGLGLTSVCQRLRVPVVFSFHDFYTICPQLKLLDENGTFCGGRCTASKGDCEPDLWPARSAPPLKHRFVHRWREMMGKVLDQCDALVTTSTGTRATILDAFPNLGQKDFRIIPHGRSFATMENLAALPTIDDKLRVLLPGNMTVAKGAAFFTAVADLDVFGEVEFHLLGEPHGI
ncbi:MAG: glycosyltransferase, partial [Deltaproteobacteria bacterium]|nr:glycosyltransferase [Deltaproteobacteria bacterium]